jgi:serine/threonine protein kinase/Tol biopolymer transport system component
MNEREIFLQALDIVDPQQRSRYLDAACGGDGQLREQVERLIRAHAAADQFLETPPSEVRGGRTTAGSHDTAAGVGQQPDLSFLRPCDTPQRLGCLGAYEVLQVLGQGGMGLVLRAFDVTLSRVVAIKVLAPELAANAMARQRFLREARAAAAISHPNVVTIYAVDETERLPFIVMECVQGQTLQQKIDQVGALELEEILRIGAQIAQGLAAAHAQGIVHRDVKPGNVLLENGIERVKLTDFGLARAADDIHITQTGYIAGTPQYMSPEQAEGKPIDHRSDLFSLGSVMYAMCTGRAAFRAESALAVLRRVCEDAPRHIHDINPLIPPWLIDTVDRLLAKDPVERFATADEVAQLLNAQLAHLQQSTLTTKPTPLAVRTGATGRRREPSDGQSGPPAPRSRRRRWLLAATMICLGGVLFAAGVASLYNGDLMGVKPAEVTLSAENGQLFLDVSDPSIDVTVIGREFYDMHANGKTLSLPPGSYTVIASRRWGTEQMRSEETVQVRSGERTHWRREFPAPTKSVPDPVLSIRAEPVTMPEATPVPGWGGTLSPDGAQVACTAVDRTDGTAREVLVAVDVATGERRVLSPDGKDPAWSPMPGGPIAFVRNTAAGEELWLIESDGSNPRKLTAGGYPSWARDGERIFFYHQPSAEVRAVSVRDPQAAPSSLLKNPGTLYPAVSPDGTRVAVRHGGRTQWLVVLDVATGEKLMTVSTPDWDGLLPGWSPDGRYLLFGSFAVRDNKGLCLLDMQTGEARQVLAGQFTMPRWSADGTRMVIDNRARQQLLVVAAEALGLSAPAGP